MNNNLKNWKIMQLLNIYNQSHAWKKDIFKVLWFYVKNYESLICGKKSDILELLNNTMVLHQNHGFIWKIMQLLNIYNQSHVWKKTFSRSFDFTSTIMNVWFPIRPIFLMLISISMVLCRDWATLQDQQISHNLHAKATFWLYYQKCFLYG